MNFPTLPTDMEMNIISFLPARGPSNGVNHLFRSMSVYRQTAAAIKIQRWYRYRRLLEIDGAPPDQITHWTLVRFYIAKYKTQWLEEFPRRAIKKCAITGVDAEFSKPLVGRATSRFRIFCLKHMTHALFKWYGW